MPNKRLVSKDQYIICSSGTLLDFHLHHLLPMMPYLLPGGIYMPVKKTSPQARHHLLLHNPPIIALSTFIVLTTSQDTGI